MSLLRKIIAGVGDLVTDAWGVQKISLPLSLYHGTFTFDIPTSWFQYENGSQVASSTVLTSVDGEAVIETSAVLTDNYIETRECPRYQPNRGHLFSTALRCENKTLDGIREWGLATVENGVFFRLKSDGLLYAVLLSGGVEKLEEVIDTSVLTGFDIEKGNIYDIQFQWRGAGDYHFYIGNPATGTSKLVHSFTLLGTLTEISMENPALPIRFRAIRTTADVAMHVGCADITSENGGQLRTNYASAYSELAPYTTDTPILVVRQPSQIGGQTNTRSVIAVRVTVKCTKKATFKVWITRDPTDIIGATYKIIGTGSYLETDSTDMDATAVRATAATVANMQFITMIAVESNLGISTETPFADSIKLVAVRGDYIVVTCTSAGAGTADAALEWGEEE